ncbi:protein phosphatase 2C domain-containing protein [candidate division CSSED10-310 bacterium]|uniref:Protein phosphatase 2C domain-containing protein n=1 Tax=candidate division CSSED10-310 bacterium TaxID=2855610 RepID=A0ABV6YSM9_UNCC1
MKYVAISETGNKRKTNQDNYCIIEEETIFVVADGMGGHKGGETASEIAVTEIQNFYQLGDTIDVTRTDLDADLDQQRLRNLRHAIRQASRAIHKESTIKFEKRGMGTTIVVLQLTDKKAFVAHVGDSRLYRLNGNKIRQITKDHSRLQELLDMEQVTLEEAKNYPFKNVITRALGSGTDIEVDAAMFPYSTQDAFFLCTDGICGVVEDDEIAEIIYEYGGDPQKALQKLGELVDENDSPDNYTGILIVGQDYVTADMDDKSDSETLDTATVLPDEKFEETGPVKISDLEGDVDQLVSPIPELQGFKLYDDQAISASDTPGNSAQEPLLTDQVSEISPAPVPAETVSESDAMDIDHLRDTVAVPKFEMLPDRKPHDMEVTDKISLAELNEEITAVHLEKQGKSLLSPTTKRYLVITILLIILYLTLCTINRLTYWVRYNGETNSLDILQGKFHPFERTAFDSIDVVPSQLWMQMIPDQEIRSALNEGKSFFRSEDMHNFIARFFLDIGLRYLTEGGLKVRLIAVDLFKKGRAYGRKQQINENLLKALYLVGRDHEESGDIEKALKYYNETLELDPDYRDTLERLAKFGAQKKPAPADSDTGQ